MLIFLARRPAALSWRPGNLGPFFQEIPDVPVLPKLRIFPS
jgi:hypothetical protein